MAQADCHSEVRVSERLFLTVPEASDYSGLPQTHLRLRQAARLEVSAVLLHGGADEGCFRRIVGGGLAQESLGSWKCAEVHLSPRTAARGIYIRVCSRSIALVAE